MSSSTATIPPVKALQLHSLITLTEQASRVLAKTSGGNLTLFAFDAGLGRPPGWGAARSVLGRDRRHRPLRGQWHTPDLDPADARGWEHDGRPVRRGRRRVGPISRAIRGHRVGRSPRDPDGDNR